MSELRKAEPSCVMTGIHEEQLLRVLGEVPEPLFPPEITDRLNRELGGETRYTLSEVVILLRRLSEKLVEQTSDGRWTLRRRLS
jgi:hypothetical protein